VAKSKRKKKQSKKKKQALDLQKWFLNLVIFCLSIVIVGFMFSSGRRLLTNKNAIVLNQATEAVQVTNIRKSIILEVLNGCGEPGVASKFSDYIRHDGFDVLYIGNAKRKNFERTLLIDRTNNPGKTEELRLALMLDSSRVVLEKDSLRMVDLTLIIGHDFDELAIFSKIE
jgi:hypothetical protein